MEIAAALNPFAGQGRYRAVWNALMASYTFRNLSAAEQRAVLACVRSSVSGVSRYTLEEVLRRCGTIVFLNFIALGLAEKCHAPALGNRYWLPIKNPIVECYGAESSLADVKARLEEEHPVTFDMDFDEFTGDVCLLSR